MVTYTCSGTNYGTCPTPNHRCIDHRAMMDMRPMYRCVDVTKPFTLPPLMPPTRERLAPTPFRMMMDLQDDDDFDAIFIF